MPVLKLYEITTPADDTTQNNYEIAPNPKTFSYNDNTTSYEGSTFQCWEGNVLVGDKVTEPRMIKRFKHAVNDTIPDILPRLVAERNEYSSKFRAILNNAAVNFGVFLDEPCVECAKNIYMIQQRFDGTTLKDLEPKCLKNELMYASSVAGTLHQLENKGYVYGDIKAENLLVKTGSTDIMFFDLNTTSRSVFQIQRDKQISTNSLCPINLDLNGNFLKTIDTYMLGQLLAKRLLCKDPDHLLLTEIAELEMDIPTFRSHLRTFEDDHFLTNAVARKLLALLKKALAVCSGDRYESAADMKKDLDEIIIETKYQLVAKKPSCIDRAKFLGREAQLKELANLLRQNSLVFISGGGGIGKTELAAQYAATQADQGKTVVQMHYMPGTNDLNDDEPDHSGIRQLLMNLAISNFPPPPTPPAPGALKAQGNSVSYLQQRKVYYNRKLEILRTLCNEHVLLIIDNFNVESDVGLAELQNTLNGAQCIITTWCDYSKLGYAQLQLENSERDAGWLEQLFRAQCSNPEKPNREVLHEIIQKIEFHTTAIILLGAQMEADWNDENELLRQLKLGLQQVGEVTVGFHKDGMDRMDQRAFGYLKAIFNISSLDQEKRHLLGALSFISSQKFDRDMLLKWIPDVDKAAVNQLVRFRWIEKEDNGKMHLPQVIADVVFDWASGKFASFLDYLHQLAQWLENLPDDEQYSHLELLKTVAERFLYCAKELDTRAEEDVLSVAAEVGNSLATTLAADWQYATPAEELYSIVIVWYQRLADVNPTQYSAILANANYNFGNYLCDVDELEVAEGLFREAIKIYENLAKESPERYGIALVHTYFILGDTLYDIGRTNEAEDTFRNELEILRSLAKNFPTQYTEELAIVYRRLASDLLIDHNRTDEAYAFFQEAITLYRRLAEKDPARYSMDFIYIVNNFSIVLLRIGYPECVASLSLEALELLHKPTNAQYSGNIADIADIADRLGTSLRKFGQTEAAEVLYREALAIRRELKAGNPTKYSKYLAGSFYNLADLICEIDSGRAGEAEQLYNNALSIQRDIAAHNPTSHSINLPMICNDFGVLLDKAGRTDEAEALYQESLVSCQELAAENPAEYSMHLAGTFCNLGNLLKKTGRSDKAETCYRKALEIYRNLVLKHPTQYIGALVSTCNNLGILLDETGRTDKAEALYREALTSYWKLVATGSRVYSIDLAGTCCNLGNLLKKAGRTDEAEALHREALTSCMKLIEETEKLRHEAVTIIEKVSDSTPAQENAEPADIDTEPSQTNRVGAFFKKLVIALAKLLKKLHM